MFVRPQQRRENKANEEKRPKYETTPNLRAFVAFWVFTPYYDIRGNLGAKEGSNNGRPALIYNFPAFSLRKFYPDGPTIKL